MEANKPLSAEAATILARAFRADGHRYRTLDLDPVVELAEAGLADATFVEIENCPTEYTVILTGEGISVMLESGA